jgi:hypothetical protein
MDRFDKEDRSLVSGLVDRELLERMGYEALVRQLSAHGKADPLAGPAAPRRPIPAG